MTIATNSALRRILLCLILLAFQSRTACNAREGSSTTREGIKLAGSWISLTLIGYNYTNRYIDDFSVNGNGGGNLFVSNPRGGGGGSVCCVNYITNIKDWKVTVQWHFDACTYNNRKNEYAEPRYEIHRYFKEVEVQVNQNITAKPKYLEVHFYPDGHVEVALTENSSPPRLRLGSEREDNSPYRQCPNDKRPQE
jgi:hypothetical protein